MVRSTAYRVIFLCLVLSSAFAKEKWQTPAPMHLDHEGRRWAEKTLQRMSVEEKVGQLFMVWVRAEFLNEESPEYLKLRDTIGKYHLGCLAMTVQADGPFLYRNEPYEAATLLNRLQKDSKLPLLVAADFERGVSMRLHGATVFPHAMAFGAAGKTEYAEEFGKITALEARAIGVHWNFFPDADVNSNPANPIINTRSFGEDPRQVGDLVAAYIKGAHEYGMMSTAKHFPGHGDTGTDSHLGVAQVTGDLARLQSVELPPFRQAIAAGVDAVMVAHVTVPALEPDASRVAATSSSVVTDLLRKQLDFHGIAVTDALDMAGLTRLYSQNIGRAAVDAFKAGNDVLILPADLDASYRAMLAAVRSHEITEKRLDASVLKILEAKASLNLQRAREVEIDALPEEIGKPENLAIGQQVADDAITLVRDNGKVLPLTQQKGTVKAELPYQKVDEVGKGLVAVILTDDVRTENGRLFERQLRARVPDVNVLYVDPRIAAPMTDSVLAAVGQAKEVIVAIYEIPTAGKALKTDTGVSNSVAVPDATAALLGKIVEHAAEKTVVVAMGNPYMAADFPAIQNYMCAFSNATVSEISAVKALFGEIPIRGHLPVTIPGMAQRGFGMERPVAAAGGERRQ